MGCCCGKVGKAKREPQFQNLSTLNNARTPGAGDLGGFTPTPVGNSFSNSNAGVSVNAQAAQVITRRRTTQGGRRNNEIGKPYAQQNINKIPPGRVKYWAAISLLSEITSEPESNLKSWINYAQILSSGNWVYKDIMTSINNGQCHNFGIKVNYIIQIARRSVTEFRHLPDFDPKALRMLLWHGTPMKNVAKILEMGLQIPNCNGNPTSLHLMQGLGIYFADRVSKSANYCSRIRRPQAGETGILFLCDVLLIKYKTDISADHGRTTAPEGFKSIKCPGKKIPCPSGTKKVYGSKLLAGQTINNDKYPNNPIEFNEYTIYDPDQINIKYVVAFEFTPNWYENVC